MRTQVAQARAARADVARRDFDEFVRFAMRDEETGRPISQAPLHEFWTTIRQRHRRAVIESAPELGKTLQLSQAFVLHELGRDPRLRVAIISDTQSNARKNVRIIGNAIQFNERVRQVFPYLRPGAKWTETTLEIRRPPEIKEPSVQAFGIGSGAIQGARIDLAILDDILVRKNTRTKTQRDDIEGWFWETIYNRLTEEGRIYLIGNTWHPDDLIHRLMKQRWPHYRFPLIIDARCAAYAPMFVEGESVWPTRWPMHRIADVRAQTPPAEFARIRLCVAADAATSRFRPEWFDRARTRGESIGFLRQASSLRDLFANGVVPPDARIGAYVDLATGKGRDVSAISVVLGRSNGDRALIHLRAGDWKADEIGKHIAEVHAAFKCTIVVENVGTQDLFAQLLKTYSDMPVETFDTRDDVKFHPVHGVDGWATELHNNKWIFPAERDPEIDALVEEAITFQPDRHAGDRLMTIFFARNHLRGLYAHDDEDVDAFAGFAAAMGGRGR